MDRVLGKLLVPALASAVIFPNSTLAGADSESRVRAVEAQLEALVVQLEELKRVQAEQATAAPAEGVGSPVVQGPNMSFPSGPSFKIGDTAVRIGGYVKADLFYDLGPQGGAARFDPGIPLGDSAQDEGEFSMSAAETRVNLATSTPVGDYGDLTTFIEGYFFDLENFNKNQIIANDLDFQLRHAWGQIGTKDLNFRAGQDWTTFTDPTIYPETNDFAVPSGASFLRQPQMRITSKVGPGHLSVALENPESDLTYDDGSFFGVTSGGVNLFGGPLSYNQNFGHDSAIDVVAKYQINDDWGRVNFVGMGRQVGVDSASFDLDDSSFGWGLGVSSRINTIGKDNLKVALHGGDGIGRYIFDAQNSGGFVDSDGNLETQLAYGGYAAYQHWWNDELRSNVVLGFTDIDVADDNVPGANDFLKSAHVNLMWSPVPRTRFGIEYIYAGREVKNGDSGDFQRVAASVRYDF